MNRDPFPPRWAVLAGDLTFWGLAILYAFVGKMMLTALHCGIGLLYLWAWFEYPRVSRLRQQGKI